MFQNGWKEQDSSKICIPDCLHRNFCAMIKYFYTRRLPDVDDLQAEDGLRSDHATLAVSANGQDYSDYSSNRDDDNY